MTNENELDKRASSLPLYLGLLPVLFLILIIGALELVYNEHPVARMVFEPPLLLPILHTTILFPASCIVAYIAMKSYLLRGSSTILLLGCGVLALGIGVLPAGWLLGPEGPNVNVTIFNMSIFFASAFHMSGTIVNLIEIAPEANSERRRKKLAIGYFGVVVLVALCTVAAVSGILPTFFIQGKGPTPIRQAILAVTFVLFMISSTSMMIRFIQNKSRFLYWYALALALLSISLVGTTLQTSVGSPMGWAGRCGQDLSGIYFIIAVVSALRGAQSHGLALNDAIAEIFRQSEQKISSIFAHITDCYYELDRDWRFTRINDQALAYFGKRREEFIDKSYLDVLPASSGSIFEEQYRRVLLEGVPAHFDVPSAVIPGRWVEINAYPIKEGLSVYFRDITERKKIEDELLAAKAEAESRAAEAEEGKRILDAIMEHIPEGITIASAPDAITTHTSKFGLDQLAKGWDASKGMSMEDWLARVDHFLPDCTTPARVQDLPLWRAIKRGETVMGQELTLRNSARQLLSVLCNAGPIKDNDGNITGGVVAWRDISERKRTEQILSETHQRLQALMHALPVGVSFSDDPTCQSITGNPTVLTQFEVGSQDNLSASALDTTAPGRQVRFYIEGREISDSELPLQRAVAENQVIPPMELEVLLPSGRRWFAEASGAPIRNGEGEVIGGVAVTVDITERKRAEEMLREAQSEAQRYGAEMGTLMDAVPAAVFVAHDVECHHMSGSRFTQELLGLPGTSNFSKSAPPLERPTHFRAMKNGVEIPPDELPVQMAAKGREIHDYEFELLFDDGESRHLLGNATPLCNAEGEVIGSVGAFVDITESKRAEQELSRSYEFTRAILDTVDGLIVILDRNGHIVRFNSACERLTGWRADEVIGRCFWEFLIPEEQRVGVLATFSRLTKGIFPNQHENDWIARDGRKRWITWENSVLLDESGKIEYVIGTGIDITDRKQMEEELRKSRDELELRVQERTAELNSYMAKLEQSNQALQDFASIASHDLQEPLRKVKAFGDMLKQKCGGSLGRSRERLPGEDTQCQSANAIPSDGTSRLLTGYDDSRAIQGG